MDFANGFLQYGLDNPNFPGSLIKQDLNYFSKILKRIVSVFKRKTVKIEDSGTLRV